MKSERTGKCSSYHKASFYWCHTVIKALGHGSLRMKLVVWCNIYINI